MPGGSRVASALASIGVVLALVISCVERGAEPPPKAVARPPRTLQVADAAGEPIADSAARAEIRFETVPRTVPKEPSPHVEIQFPFAEQAIRVDKAQKYKVRLKVENWPIGSDGRGIDVVLDDFRPRRVVTLDPPLELGQLVPEDAELRPGEHTLVAMAVRESGEIVRPPTRTSLAPFALVHFWIGERGAARTSPSSPRIVYAVPRGTINGQAAAERILLDFLPIGVDLGSGKTTVVVRVRGDAASGSTVLQSWDPLLLLDVPSGDYDVELELIGPDGRPLAEPHARAGRTITVNRDAPVVVPDGGT